MSFRIGIIGAGSIGEVHAEAATKAGQQIAGFCDIRLAKAQRLADKHPGAMATVSLDELLKLPDMPAVVVGVPNHLHKPIAVAALNAGKDVLLEKPMALNVSECDEIISAQRRSKRILQMGFVSRLSATSLAARQFIDAGRLGAIYHIKASIYRRRGIPGLGRWFTSKAESGGGALIDLGVHMIDLAMHLADRPKAQRVSAVCTKTFGDPIEKYAFTEMWAGPPETTGRFDVEDAATALIRFAGGMTMELNVVWAANIPDNVLPGGLGVMGDRGGCWFDPSGRRITLATEEDGFLADVSPQLPPGEPWPLAFRREHDLFAQSVERRTAPSATTEHGREVQQVIDALYRSSAEGREVEIV